jgi:hypothetical protein
MIAAQVDQAVLEALVEQRFPAFAAALNATGVPLGCATAPWFLACFATSLPRRPLLRLWDALLLERSRAVLFQAALALIQPLAAAAAADAASAAATAAAMGTAAATEAAQPVPDSGLVAALQAGMPAPFSAPGSGGAGGDSLAPSRSGSFRSVTPTGSPRTSATVAAAAAAAADAARASSAGRSLALPHRTRSRRRSRAPATARGAGHTSPRATTRRSAAASR